MFRTFRCALVATLTSLMTVGPAGAYYGMDCGCSEPKPQPAPACCEPACVECESPCGDSPCEAAPVEKAPCGCESTMDDMGAYDAQPDEEMPSTAPITPLMPAEPAPAKTDPMPVPATEPPVTTEKPIPQPSTPAAEPTENLFNAPATTPAVPPPAEEAAPAAEPAAETPPAEAPATDTTDDLFNSAPAESTPPVEEPATDAPAADETEKEETPPAEKTEDPLEDFFNAVPRPSALQVAGGLESNVRRTWIDNTGKYRCEARLVNVTPHDVVLAKVDGKVKTVSLQRLSDADLRFVHEQVVAKREVLARSGAGEKLAGR